MKYKLISILILVFAVYLDSLVDELRINGVNNIFVDCAPSLISSVFLTSSYLIFFGCSEKQLKNANYLVLGIVLYEFIELHESIGIFDWFDVLVSAFGFLVILITKEFTRIKNTLPNKDSISIKSNE